MQATATSRGPVLLAVPLARPSAEEATQGSAELMRRWRTVVHDDPVNTMNYVVWVFRSHFGFSVPVARARMMEVHTTGRAVVSRGPRERMESDVTAMHSYGLRATIEPEDDGVGSGAGEGA